MIDDEEVWLPARNFEGYYEVSTFGRIRTVNRSFLSTTDIKIFNQTQIISNLDNLKTGYDAVMLYRNNYPYKILVHELVAQTFLPNPFNRTNVRHKDGNIHNNFASNLEWADVATPIVISNESDENVTEMQTPEASCESDVAEDSTVDVSQDNTVDAEETFYEVAEVAESIVTNPIETIDTEISDESDLENAADTDLLTTSDAEHTDVVANTAAESNQSTTLNVPKKRSKFIIVCIEDDEIFESYEAAGKYYGISGSTVSDSIKAGRTTRIGKTFQRVATEEV